MRAVRLVAATLLGVVAIATAGCGTDAGADDGADRTTTIEHRFGSTTVEGTPTRIVAVGSQWLDALLEFGVQPVAYLAAGDRGDERGLYPWEGSLDASAVELDRAVLGQLGASLPVEEIAAQDPDLILGSFVAGQSDFDRVSKIAPTIGEIGDAQVDSWEDQVTALGRILGRQDRAEEIISATNGEIDALAARLPGLKGKTAVLSQFVFKTNQLVVVADPKDGASQTFARLGMTVPPRLVEEAGATGGRLLLSPERVDALTADLVVMLPNGGTRDDLMKLPGFAALPSVGSGGLAVEDYPTVVGFNTPSSASLRYALGRITPQLEAIGR
ncbi:ABC transporter substrate-binding protein [Rhodococcus maanshanensis]|uniref:ABC transporter substrate-binding protein n=1 Tax=Rhodococcus maanshanensis TaxID=183556 RepID=UPI0009356180|nr:ABC transporter substrate-binding protein [Rhodococcus maanshanensis]